MNKKMPNYGIFLDYALPELVEEMMRYNGGSLGPKNEVDITDQIQILEDLTTRYNPFRPEYLIPNSAKPLYRGPGDVPGYVVKQQFDNSP